MEQILTGGRMTADVVRIDDTVRRPASVASPFVARLLRHLAVTGFDGAPRHLGWDDHGRDMLSYLPGRVPPKWQRFADEQITAAARLARQMHEASRALAARIGFEVICHHDLGPNNTVFRAGTPVAFIDFDGAAAGDALEDVAYMAWSWCLSSRPDREPVDEQMRQVRLLAEAYGLTPTQRRRLPAAILDRMERNEDFWQHEMVARRERAQSMCDWTRREMAFVRTHRTALVSTLA